MTKRKPKLGRPRLPAEQKRGVFALRLTNAERAMIERAARVEGVPTSEWARTALLGASEASARAHHDPASDRSA